jgi:MFS family permease
MSVAPAGAPQNTPASRAGWYAVSVLIVAYTFSYVDRTILTLMVKPIRASLQISDLQLSLLHGLAFAIFYTLLGIPIARLADRGNRRNIIAVGVAFWSVMTALCGLARNFSQLFLARVGVGVGEAALSPAAYSMLSDYFRGNALTRALSVYTAAIYVGAGLALMIGGVVIASVPALELPLVGHLEPWQVVFLCVGAPGVLIALLMLTVREPPRSGLLAGAGSPQTLSFGDVLRYMSARRGAYYFLIFGFAVHSLVWNGAMGWIPTFFIRHFGWTQAQTGLQFGAVLMTFGTIGIVSGGFLSGWLKARGRVDANPLVGLISALLVLPAGVLAAQSDNPATALTLFAVFVFSGSMPYGAAATAFQDISPNQMRAQVTAIYFFALNLCGIGLGPTVVAAFTDKVFRSDAAVGDSLALVIGLAAPLSALLLWLSLKPYRRALTENRHLGAES